MKQRFQVFSESAFLDLIYLLDFGIFLLSLKIFWNLKSMNYMKITEHID